MRYVIDKSRPDGYYHYIKYDDNDSSVLKTYYDTDGEITKIKFNVGWSLYSKQETPEEKTQWIKAVQEYQKAKSVTGLTDTLHSYIQDIRDMTKIHDRDFPENMSPIMPSIAALASLAEGDVCDDEFLKKIYEAGLSELPTTKEMLKYAWKAERFNVKNEVYKMAHTLAQLGVNTFVTPVLDMADGMIDSVFGTIDAVYTEVVRLGNRAYRLYKKIVNTVTDPEERKKLFKQLLEELKKLGKDIYEYLYQALCIDAFIEIFKTLKNLWQTRKEIWKTLIAKLKTLIDFDYKSLKSDIINNLAGIILAFLPLLGALLGAFFAKVCGDQQDQLLSKKMMAYYLTDGKSTNPDDVPKLQDDIIKTNRKKLRGASVVYSLCCDEENNFAFHKKYKSSTKDSSIIVPEDSSINEEEPIELNCKVSMCDYEPFTNFDYFPNETARFANLVTIEFDKSYQYSFCVSLGQIVKIDDTIGYLSGIAVKSQFDFKVIEIGENYIVGEYYYDETLLNTDDPNFQENIIASVNSRINALDTSEYEKLKSNFTDVAGAEDFLMNYANYCRIPDFALNTGNYLFSKTISNYIDDYYDFLDNAKQKDVDKIKKVAGKENAEKRGKEGKLYTLKQEVDDVKNVMVNRFIKYTQMKNCGVGFKSKGRIADYSLYSYYLDYLYSDRFLYNEDNKFIVKLHNLISEFITERTKIELSTENIDALIVDFNETCNTYLAKYWQHNNQSYYQTFANLFTSDYYETNMEKIIPTTDTSNSMSLYNRVYMYLNSITSFTPQKSQNKITIDENTDVNALLGNMSKMSDDSAINKDDEKIKTNLRRIALKFVTIRKVEQNMKNGFVERFAAENKIAIRKLQQGTSNPIPISDYYAGEVINMGESTLNRSTYLGPYLNTLKQITQAESDKLHKLIKEAIDWYNANAKDNDSIIKLFKPLMQINWPCCSIIYKNNEKCDFYLFSPIMSTQIPPTTMKELLALENQPKPTDQSDPGNIGAFPRSPSGYGVSDIQYWLRYCGIATAVHCMMPMYWSTGLILPPVPYIMLPVIYIPFFVLSGRVTVVFGIGLCGIIPMPMILFANLGSIIGSIIIPINMVVDMLKQMAKQLANMENIALEGIIEPMIISLEQQIRELEQEKADIPYQIAQIKALSSKKKVKDLINITVGNDITSKKENGTEDQNFVEQEYPSIDEQEEAMVSKMDNLAKELNDITLAHAERISEYQADLTAAENALRAAEESQLERWRQENVASITGQYSYVNSSDAGDELYVNTNTCNLVKSFFPDEVQRQFVNYGTYTKVPPKSVISKYITTFTVETMNGPKQLSMHEKLMPEVQEIFRKLKAVGFNVKTLGGWSYRCAKKVTGGCHTAVLNGRTINIASNHTFGLAFDINAFSAGNGYDSISGTAENWCKNHKYDPSYQCRSNNDQSVRIILSAPAAGIGKWGWGGNYNSSKDWMHFSANGGK